MTTKDDQLFSNDENSRFDGVRPQLGKSINLVQWVCWRYAMVKKRKTKIPVYGVQDKRGHWHQKNASVSDSSTWMTFDTAVMLVDELGVDGIGFVFTDDNWLMGIDVDKCYDKEGNINELGERIVNAFDHTYIERSPSGKGLHVLLEGEISEKYLLPTNTGRRNHSEGLEIYQRGRFFTFTGNALNDSTIALAQDELDALLSDYMPPLVDHFDESSINAEDLNLCCPVDEDILTSLQENTSFMSVWNRENGLESQSEFDLSMCNVALMVDADLSPQILSDLIYSYRAEVGEDVSKAGRRDYILHTVGKALASATKFAELKAFRVQLTSDYVYLEEVDGYLKTQTGAVVKDAAVNKANLKNIIKVHASVKDEMKDKDYSKKDKTKVNKVLKDKFKNATTIILTDETSVKADNIGYLPGESSIFEWNGRRLINTYKGCSLVLPEHVGDEDVQCWLDHVAYLIPDLKEREHLFDWMAFNVQFPETKVNHHPLVCGKSRNGKDSIFEPLRFAFGDGGTIDIDSRLMGDSINQTHVLGHKVIFSQECQSFEKASLENSMKVHLAAPPNDVQVRIPGGHRVLTPNISSWVFQSNERRPLSIKEHGRYFGVWCGAERREDEWYGNLWGWYKRDQGIEKVIKWLKQRDIDHFSPTALPPRTAFIDTLIIQSQPERVSSLEAEFQDGAMSVFQWREIVTWKELEDAGEFCDAHTDAVTLKHTLVDLGWNSKKLKVVVKGETLQPTVWFSPKGSHWLEKMKDRRATHSDVHRHLLEEIEISELL